MSALEERGVVDRVMQSLNLSEDTGGGEPCVGGDAKPPLHIPNKETPCKEVGKSPQKGTYTYKQPSYMIHLYNFLMLEFHTSLLVVGMILHFTHTHSLYSIT